MLLLGALLLAVPVFENAASSFLGEILCQRCICFELGVSVSIDIGQNSSALPIDVTNSTKVYRQLPPCEGRTERLPGSIQFRRPRSDDPSLELQHQLVSFFLDCDS